MSENELEILLPDADLTLAGEAVTVREYRFKEGLKVQTLAKPLLADLSALFLGMDETDPLPDEADTMLLTLSEIFARHESLMSRIISISIDREPAWVDALSDSEGQTLLMIWWRVNRDFFVRRLTTQLVARRARTLSAGDRSSPG